MLITPVQHRCLDRCRRSPLRPLRARARCRSLGRCPLPALPRCPVRRPLLLRAGQCRCRPWGRLVRHRRHPRLPQPRRREQGCAPREPWTTCAARCRFPADKCVMKVLPHPQVTQPDSHVPCSVDAHKSPEGSHRDGHYASGGSHAAWFCCVATRQETPRPAESSLDQMCR